jgi:hypothetical protein
MSTKITSGAKKYICSSRFSKDELDEIKECAKVSARGILDHFGLDFKFVAETTKKHLIPGVEMVCHKCWKIYVYDKYIPHRCARRGVYG